ncbi:MAG: hypothetical protein SH819_15030 [Cytophagales bacterium]|nr:hypothetical protein [Cytophagales bacterium]
MRLGQLARRLAIKPDEIVRFLASNEITIESGGNTRLDDKHVDLILERFAPKNEALQHEIQAAPDRVEEPSPVPDSQESTADSPDPEVQPETIKAPKVELAGLKVLGKIELPEKKKPEPLQEEPPTSPSRPNRIPRANPPRAWKNPLALEREKEEGEKREKLKKQREAEKERRKDFYLNRLQPQTPAKQMRFVDEEVIEMPTPEPEIPKTSWGRFLRWLNT